MKHGKKYLESAKLIESSKLYDPDEAVKLALQTAKTKFDETMEISVRLGVDPRQADQQVRGAVVLPHGTGKKVRVLVFAKGEQAKAAEEAAKAAENAAGTAAEAAPTVETAAAQIQQTCSTGLDFRFHQFQPDSIFHLCFRRNFRAVLRHTLKYRHLYHLLYRFLLLYNYCALFFFLHYFFRLLFLFPKQRFFLWLASKQGIYGCISILLRIFRHFFFFLYFCASFRMYSKEGKLPCLLLLLTFVFLCLFHIQTLWLDSLCFLFLESLILFQYFPVIRISVHI